MREETGQSTVGRGAKQRQWGVRPHNEAVQRPQAAQARPQAGARRRARLLPLQARLEAGSTGQGRAKEKAWQGSTHLLGIVHFLLLHLGRLRQATQVAAAVRRHLRQAAAGGRGAGSAAGRRQSSGGGLAGPYIGSGHTKGAAERRSPAAPRPFQPQVEGETALPLPTPPSQPHLQAVRQRNQPHISGGQRVDVARGARKLDDCHGGGEAGGQALSEGQAWLQVRSSAASRCCPAAQQVWRSDQALHSSPTPADVAAWCPTRVHIQVDACMCSQPHRSQLARAPLTRLDRLLGRLARLDGKRQRRQRGAALLVAHLPQHLGRGHAPVRKPHLGVAGGGRGVGRAGTASAAGGDGGGGEARAPVWRACMLGAPG